jgi:tetratricopeptide (TPR) repeat protein
MTTPEELLEQAKALNEENKYTEVIELLTDEILESYQNADLNNEKAEAYVSLGKEYAKSNENEKAIEACRRAISIFPKNIRAYFWIGMVYKDQKEFQKGIDILEKALEINPNSDFILYGLTSIFIASKNFDKALINVKKALEIDPDYLNYSQLGDVYMGLNNFDEALKSYDKAIEINPKNSYRYYLRAKAHVSNGNYEFAISDYEKYIELENNTSDYFTSVAKSKIEELKKIINDQYYSPISEMVEKIKVLLLFQDTCVTHYTGLSVAKALILDKSKFRLSEGAFLNDTSEGQELFKYLPDIRKNAPKNETVALPFINKPFIGSFVSEKKLDDLTLWRMYGKENKDEARGCALTLDKDKLLENLKESLIADGKKDKSEIKDGEFSFYRIAYRKEGQEELFIIPGATTEIENSLNKYMNDLRLGVQTFLEKRTEPSDIQNLLELLNTIAYLFKSAEYQYEHELRLVIEGVGFEKVIDSSLLRVYIELVPICPFIRKITLGPKIERADEWAAAFYYSLDKQDFHPEILISHLPFK